ncbi:MAG: MBL fold metallo-hydrolase [Candidatus Pacebacteria bacterium]|nr:MBL fold metallo-hydrolase [Candidatus Paceibacterota bacterium]
MIITYNAVESFKVQQGDLTIAVNPVSKRSKHPGASFGADIVLVSTNHEDFNGIESVSRGEKTPFVIQGPGEYEVGGIFIRGFGAKTMLDGVEALTTIYLVTLEESQLCFLGALGTPNLSPEVLEALPDIDILFVPIGGNGVLTPAEAHKLVVSLDPSVIVPMHYNKDTLAGFLKEEGATATPIEKLTIKKKELLEKDGEVIVLAPQSV